MLTLVDVFLLFGITFVGAAAQLFLKQGSNLGKRRRFFCSFFEPCIIIGVGLMVVNALAFVLILRRLPLTAVVPVTALAYVLVPAGAFLFFREQLRLSFWLGALLIIVGIAIIAI